MSHDHNIKSWREISKAGQSLRSGSTNCTSKGIWLKTLGVRPGRNMELVMSIYDNNLDIVKLLNNENVRIFSLSLFTKYSHHQLDTR